MYATIHPIEPFDSSTGTTIHFSWQGNQIYKARCLIKDNASGTTVFDKTISTMKQSYTLPADSGLKNGGYYVAYLSVFDIDDKESTLPSIGTPFYCYETPEFKLSVNPGDVLKSSAFQTELVYSQKQNEPLNSFCITLYTYQKTELQTSGDLYNTSELTYLISGLENAKQYYLRATGKTLHNMSMDTGYILFTVSYTQAQIFNPLELNNRAEHGAIEIKSNIISTIGVPEKDVIYLENEYGDLRENSVTYDIGFEVKGDFTKAFRFHRPVCNAKIIHFTNKDQCHVNIYYREGIYSDSGGEKAFFELEAVSSGSKYILFTKYLPIPKDTQQFVLCINRTSSYYEMKADLVNK